MSPGSLLLEAATWEVPRNSWPHLLPCLSSKLCLQFSPSQTKGWDPREERKLGSQGPSPGLAFCARALWSSLASKSVCTEGNNPGLLFLSLPTLFFFPLYDYALLLSAVLSQSCLASLDLLFQGKNSVSGAWKIDLSQRSILGLSLVVFPTSYLPTASPSVNWVGASYCQFGIIAILLPEEFCPLKCPS